MATNNNKFLVKNGLAVGSSIDVINSDGQWIGATGSLHGATGPQGEQGASGISGASGYVGSDGATGPAGTDGATGVQGASGSTGVSGSDGATGLTGSTGPLQYITYGDIDMGTILQPANISIDLGTFGGASGASGATGFDFSGDLMSLTGTEDLLTGSGTEDLNA